MDEQEFKLYELYLRIQTLESSVAAILWAISQQSADSDVVVATVLAQIQTSTTMTLGHLQALGFSEEQLQRLRATALGVQDVYEAMKLNHEQVS